MSRHLALLVVLTVALGVGTAVGQPAAPSSPSGGPAPAVGDLAPDFTLPGSDGRTHHLAEYRGVRPVVLAWFPKATATL